MREKKEISVSCPFRTQVRSACFPSCEEYFSPSECAQKKCALQSASSLSPVRRCLRPRRFRWVNSIISCSRSLPSTPTLTSILTPTRTYAGHSQYVVHKHEEHPLRAYLGEVDYAPLSHETKSFKILEYTHRESYPSTSPRTFRCLGIEFWR